MPPAEELMKMITRLDENDYRSVVDFVSYLDSRHEKNGSGKIPYTTDSINEWIQKNGQPASFTGEVGIEAMREPTKNDVW